jgi:hypothetical protein
MRERMAVYGAKMLGDQIRSGQHYKNVGEVISVLIINFPLLRETPNYHNHCKIHSDDWRIDLTDVLEFHILGLPKIPVQDGGCKVWPWPRKFNN